jgi:hypothetical protein
MIVKENIVTTTNTNAERDDLGATCEYCLQGIPLDSRMPIPMHNMMPPNTPDTDTHFWKKCRATRPSVDDSGPELIDRAEAVRQIVEYQNQFSPSQSESASAVGDCWAIVSALPSQPAPISNVAAVAEAAATEICDDCGVDSQDAERVAAIIQRHLNGTCGCAAKVRQIRDDYIATAAAMKDDEEIGVFSGNAAVAHEILEALQADKGGASDGE